MANKQALRDLQSRLADRLQAAQTEQRGRSWLAVECGARGFLFPLRDAGEIFPIAPMAPVPTERPSRSFTVWTAGFLENSACWPRTPARAPR